MSSLGWHFQTVNAAQNYTKTPKTETSSDPIDLSQQLVNLEEAANQKKENNKIEWLFSDAGQVWYEEYKENTYKYTQEYAGEEYSDKRLNLEADLIGECSESLNSKDKDEENKDFASIMDEYNKELAALNEEYDIDEDELNEYIAERKDLKEETLKQIEKAQIHFN